MDNETKTLWNIDEIKSYIKSILKPKRYKHSLRVMDESVRLATIFGADIEKCRLAGLLHDCAKDLTQGELISLCIKDGEFNRHHNVDDLCRSILHGPAGAVFAQQHFEITDNDVLEAIRYHVTGKPEMGIVTSIIFLADYTEPGRSGSSFEEIREKIQLGLLPALLAACDSTIKHIISKEDILHCDTINTRNDILRRMRYANERDEAYGLQRTNGKDNSLT